LKRVVIDASVVLKWYLIDESNSKTALEILERFVFQELYILAPNLLEYEVLNGLQIAMKRGRVDQKMLLLATEAFLGLGIDLRGISSNYEKVLHFTNVYDLTVYDSSYLEVASTEGIALITADEKLYNKVKNELKWVKWLGD